MFTPRPYQNEMIHGIYNFLSNEQGHPLVSSITGTGKSIVPAEFMRLAWEQWPNQRFMVLCHVQEVLQSNYKAFRHQNPTGSGGVYHAGLGRRDTEQNAIFAGINSIYKKPELFGHRDIVFIDEVHTVSGKSDTMYGQYVAAMKQINPHVRFVGLTATPYRLGQGMLTDPISYKKDGKLVEEDPLFTRIIYDNTNMAGFRKMLEQGYISQLISKHTAARIETTGVGTTNGDFTATQLQKAADREELTRAALDEVVAYGADRNHWLIYATGIQHAEHIAMDLKIRGVSCGVLHGGLPKAERKRIVDDFYHGRIRALANVGILTTGFDMPHLDMGVILRPTKSPGLWSQILGRFLRPFEGKENSLILDFTHNTATLGPVNDIKPPKAKGKGMGSAPVRLCEFCGFVMHASVRKCEECGAEFPPGPPKLLRQPTEAEIMRDAKPHVHELEVGSVVYTKHKGRGRKPDSMLVSYHTKNQKVYKEWICFEHEGLPLHKAHNWWKQRSTMESPVSVDDALTLSTELPQPSHIRVWVNKKYPEIMAYMLNGQEIY